MLQNYGPTTTARNGRGNPNPTHCQGQRRPQPRPSLSPWLAAGSSWELKLGGNSPWASPTNNRKSRFCLPPIRWLRRLSKRSFFVDTSSSRNVGTSRGGPACSLPQFYSPRSTPSSGNGPAATSLGQLAQKDGLAPPPFLYHRSGFILCDLPASIRATRSSPASPRTPAKTSA